MQDCRYTAYLVNRLFLKYINGIESNGYCKRELIRPVLELTDYVLRPSIYEGLNDSLDKLLNYYNSDSELFIAIDKLFTGNINECLFEMSSFDDKLTFYAAYCKMSIINELYSVNTENEEYDPKLLTLFTVLKDIDYINGNSYRVYDFILSTKSVKYSTYIKHKFLELADDKTVKSVIETVYGSIKEFY